MFYENITFSNYRMRREEKSSNRLRHIGRCLEEHAYVLKMVPYNYVHLGCCLRQWVGVLTYRSLQRKFLSGVDIVRYVHVAEASLGDNLIAKQYSQGRSWTRNLRVIREYSAEVSYLRRDCSLPSAYALIWSEDGAAWARFTFPIFTRCSPIWSTLPTTLPMLAKILYLTWLPPAADGHTINLFP